MRSLIDIIDLTVEEIDDLIATANDIIANPDKYAEKCHRKKLATLFFEPSTRTRLSFEAAMLELGGSVIGAWPFLVGGVICLLNCDNERDLNLLNSGASICWLSTS